ncbi:hypothetical protein NUW54_g7239 [Trametes sanguinea]|uniref:Uncharacterized protein n=1 Tax=Trametes sanguinea TaxID=158606 RepID=A0ACC1PNL9_9APHY|nr:hypothetical protein NUW54_g7239 [Trametes sanguinea]
MARSDCTSLLTAVNAARWMALVVSTVDSDVFLLPPGLTVHLPTTVHCRLGSNTANPSQLHLRVKLVSLRKLFCPENKRLRRTGSIQVFWRQLVRSESGFTWYSFLEARLFGQSVSSMAYQRSPIAESEWGGSRGGSPGLDEAATVRAQASVSLRQSRSMSCAQGPDLEQQPAGQSCLAAEMMCTGSWRLQDGCNIRAVAAA